MEEELRYIFYGGVEGAFQRTDLSDLSLLSSQFGAAAFGYTEGQLLQGSISFTGAALQLIRDNLPPDPLTAIEIPIGTEGLDLSFPQPLVGDYTENDLVGIDDPIRNSVDLQLTGSLDDPLAGLSLRLRDPGLGVGGFVRESGATFSSDAGAQAQVDGIWLPESIVPDFKSGGSGKDKLEGNADYNFLAGLSGNDTLTIKSGRGWAWGGNGNDLIKGSEDGSAGLFGGDFLYGGAGSDTIYGARGGDVIEGGGNADDLRGEEGNDVVGGGVGNDTVRGGSGDDFLGGQSGSDRIYGNSGADNIDGDSGNDKIDGGSGNDTIRGRQGNDHLRGGPGSDTFIFDMENEGHDTIYGFQRGIDTIRIGATGLSSFDQLIATAVVEDGDVTITYGANTLTFANTALSSLRASDFDIL